jgi:cob(I)alamin adenosyltransferase
MGNRLSKITTKSGDKGITSIVGGTRIHKHSARIKAIGDIDELNSSLGVLSTELKQDVALSNYLNDILSIQHDLFNLGGELAMPEAEVLSEESLKSIELQSQVMNSSLSPLKEFILPAGSKAVAFAHMSRAICRRAERQVVELHTIENDVRPIVLQYLNRLSDFLFILARHIGQQEGQEEVLWQR